MNVFDLVATISIDTSGYESGLQSALRASEQFGNQAESDIESSASNMENSMSSSADSITDSMESAADGVGSSAEEIGSSSESFADAVSSGADSVSSSMDSIADSASSASDGFSSAMDSVSGSMDTASGDITSGSDSGSNSIFSLMESTNGLGGVFGDIAGKAQAFGSKLVETLKTPIGAATALASAIALITKALWEGAAELAEYGDHVDKMSQKIGMSASAYQQWEYVMNRAGTDVDNLKMGMKTLSSQAEKNSDAFQKLGISQEEVASLSKEELFERTVKGLAEMEDGTERTALATQLLGRAGADMAPLLNEGTDAIDEQMQMAEDYGMVLSDDLVKASADFVDASTTLESTVRGLKATFLGELLPSMTKVKNGLAKMFAGDGEGAIEFFQGIGGFILNAIEMIPKAIGKFAVGLGKAAVAIAKALGTALIENVPVLFQKIIEGLDNAISRLSEWDPNETDSQSTALALLQKIGEGIVKYAPIVLKAIGELTLKMLQALGKLLPRLLKLGGMLMLKLLKGMMGQLGKLLAFVGKLLVQMLAKLASKMGEFLSKGKDFVLKIVQGIAGSIYLVVSKMGELASQAIQKLASWLGSFLTKGTEFVSNILSGVNQKFWDVVNRFGELASKIIEKLLGWLPFFKTKGEEMASNIGKGADDKSGTVANKFNTLGEKAYGEVSGWLPNFRQLGRDMGQGIANGLGDKISTVASKAGELVRAALAEAKAEAGIASPSKVFKKEVGAQISAGVAEGIFQNADMVENAVGNLVDVADAGNYEPSFGYEMSVARYTSDELAGSRDVAEARAERTSEEIILILGDIYEALLAGQTITIGKREFARVVSEVS